MSRLARLLRADLYQITRDPLLLLFPFLPLLVAALFRFGLPPLEALLEARFGFALRTAAGPFLPLVRAELALMPGMFAGFVAGFLLLEDRDEGLAAYAAATPLGKAGYLALRLILPGLLALAYAVSMPALAGLGWPDGRALPLGLLASLEAPLFGLAIAAVADNKMEGLSVAKALGILDLAPLAVLAPEPWRSLGRLLPPAWVAEAAYAAPGRGLLPALAAGAALHLACCFGLALAFFRRAE